MSGSRTKFDGCTCGNAEVMEHFPGCPVRPFGPRLTAVELMAMSDADFDAFIRSTGIKTVSSDSAADADPRGDG